MSKIIIVDKEDQIIGYKERNDWDKSDIIRVSALWICNSAGESLIAQRSFSKARSPGCWAQSVAGTVEEGETYESNIVKEAEEELGLKIRIEDVVSAEKNFTDTDHPYFVQMYFYKTDMPISEFILRAEEVASVRWISLEDLSKWFAEKPEDFTPAFCACLSSYIDFNNKNQ